MKTGIVLEGGAIRTMFSSGVCDGLLTRGLLPDYVIGVSAGIAYGVSYVSRQEGRNMEIMERYINDKRYKAPREMAIIASWAGGWEHVSASLRNRCPTWDEMCLVKDIFWRDDECVVQFHPPKNEYINVHPYCLHLWRKIGEETYLPPKEFV